MPATFVGVRHHSPACARLVAKTIERTQPAYVLIEGPADMNDRLDELLLGHELPVAVFTSYRDDERVHSSWSPLCEYSPEWVALTVGRETGADVRFIDLPAWHPAFGRRENRFADAEQRYETVVQRLCREFAVDNVDTLWDHLVESADAEDVPGRLEAYFDLARDEAEADTSDLDREAYMARWVRAAVLDAGPREVVVVSGGFHRPALIRLAAEPSDGWPDVPRPPEDAVESSYLVPYSFRRLDAFQGYQSGMPSPGYYQRVWDDGLEAAAGGLVADVVGRLRDRRQPVSTADLIAARSLTGGLAQLRGHRHPARTDVLDGLVAALVTAPLDVPPPWTRRGLVEPGTDPVVVEMVAALSGLRIGRLHPATPHPPLVRDVEDELARHRLDVVGDVLLDLTDDESRERSRVLHRLRILGIPDFVRTSGPTTGADPVLSESWRLDHTDLRLPALIEAGAFGSTLTGAAAAALADRLSADDGADDGVYVLAAVLFDAALCGAATVSAGVLAAIADRVGRVAGVPALGQVLGVVLGLWRHDRVLGLLDEPAVADVVIAAVPRLLWLLEGVRGGGPAPADLARLHAVVALRDAVAFGPPGTPSQTAVAVMTRIASATDVPPDLRGAGLGFAWSLQSPPVDPARAVRGAALPAVIGDWLAGLFALARDELRSDPSVTVVLDEVITAMNHRDFLIALPSLRQAFTYFPPREREAIAAQLLGLRGLSGSARVLLRTVADPMVLAEAAALEERVDAMLEREGLT